MINAIKKTNYIKMTEKLENILESVTIPKAPVIAKIKKQMIAMGADGALMSGSGPTVFGLFSKESTCMDAAAWFSSNQQKVNEFCQVTRFQRDFSY